MNCVVCKKSDIKKLFYKNNYWICACNTCDHRFVEFQNSPDHVKHVYDDVYFQDGGAGYPDYLGEQNILIKHGQRYARLLSQFMKPGEVLDVGAAAGFILKGFVNSGWLGMGIEPNQKMTAYGKMTFGLNIVAEPLEEFSSDHQFDLINMIQVIAHFYDLRKALQKSTTLIKADGCILIETWNKDSWLAKFLKSNWHEYNPPSVLNFFSPVSLRTIMAQFGFHQVAVGRPLKWISGRHAKSVIKYNLKTSRFTQLAADLVNVMPDQLTIPYPSADLFWALFKKHQYSKNNKGGLKNGRL